jgi:hypothetical protein
MDFTLTESNSPDPSSDPRQSVRNLLDSLIAAVKRWDNAWAALTRKLSPEEEQREQEKKEELFARAMEVSGWPDEIRKIPDPQVRFKKALEAGFALDPEEITRLINEDPEHQKIVRAGEDRKDAEAEIGGLGIKIHGDLQLLHLRNPDNPGIKFVLEEFRRLTERPTSTGVHNERPTSTGVHKEPLAPSGAKELIPQLEELLASRTKQVPGAQQSRTPAATLPTAAAPLTAIGPGAPAVPGVALTPTAANQGPDPTEISKRWQEDGWPAKLRKARLEKSHILKQAANACGVSVETYRPWEARRSPSAPNVRPILQYMGLM